MDCCFHSPITSHHSHLYSGAGVGVPVSVSPGRFGLRFLARSSVTGGDDGAAVGVAAGATAGGGVMRGGMVLFGPFCGTGGRAASLVSVGGSDGVGKMLRGGALGR